MIHKSIEMFILLTHLSNFFVQYFESFIERSDSKISAGQTPKTDVSKIRICRGETSNQLAISVFIHTSKGSH